MVHRPECLVGLRLVVGRILSQQLRDLCRHAESPVVVCRRVCHRPTVVVQGVACPDAAVGVVQSVVVRIEVTFLPCQVSLDHRPHPAHIRRVGIIFEVPEQLIDIVQVHVVVVHLVVAVRVSADIPLRVHLRAPFLQGPCHRLVGILRGVRHGGSHVGHLPLRIGREMAACPLGPSHHIP